MVGVWQSVVRLTAQCASAGARVCARGMRACVRGLQRYRRRCPADCIPLSRVPVLSSPLPSFLRLILPLSRSRGDAPRPTRSPSFSDARVFHTPAGSLSLSPSRSLSLPPTREHHPLRPPLTVTSLSLVDALPPPASLALAVPPLVATWLCAHAHAHTDTCRSRQERVKRFWL